MVPTPSLPPSQAHNPKQKMWSPGRSWHMGFTADSHFICKKYDSVRWMRTAVRLKKGASSGRMESPARTINNMLECGGIIHMSRTYSEAGNVEDQRCTHLGRAMLWSWPLSEPERRRQTQSLSFLICKMGSAYLVIYGMFVHCLLGVRPWLSIHNQGRHGLTFVRRLGRQLREEQGGGRRLKNRGYSFKNIHIRQ